MLGSFVSNTLKSLAPIALDWASEKATQFAQQRLGDLKNITGPALTITNIQPPLKDTFGNITDIQTRLTRLQRKCEQKMQSSRGAYSTPRRQRPMYEDQGTYDFGNTFEELPQKQIKQNEYEVDFQ